MPLYAVSDESIRQAAAVIARGGIAAFPTETVYGLGGDAFNPAALARIFEVKGRPRFDPLIVHIANLQTLQQVADLSLLDSTARKNLSALTGALWPGPLTLILPKQKTVPDLATSGLPTVAVRFPAHETAQRLITLSTGAIAAPSANPFGYISPTRAEHVLAMLGEKVEIILDGGPSRVGLESTVLELCPGICQGQCRERPRILRPGGTPKESIEALIGPLADTSVHNDTGEASMASPGMLKSHYAPRTPLEIYGNDAPNSLPDEPGSALLFFDGASRDAWLSGSKQHIAAFVSVLSETGNTLEAAARLFDLLHEMDRPGIGRIYAQLAPEEGLGAAINDRLRRAAAG